MVAVAVDREKAADPRTPEGQFLVPFLKRHPQQGSPCLYSPDGKALGGFRGYDFGQAKKVIEDGLKAFGPVEPRRVKPVPSHPHRGKGVMRDGSVCLAQYLRTSDEDLRTAQIKTPVVSSVTLSADEFSAFAPPTAEVGAKWVLPDDVAKRLSRVSSPLCYQHAPRPDWVTAVRLSAEVHALQPGAAWVRYEGRIVSAHRVGSKTVSDQEVNLTGYSVYDLKAKRTRSLLLVGSGSLRWPEAPGKVLKFDALVEWNLDGPEPASKR
jgi:hypothetical protein